MNDTPDRRTSGARVSKSKKTRRGLAHVAALLDSYRLAIEQEQRNWNARKRAEYQRAVAYIIQESEPPTKTH